MEFSSGVIPMVIDNRDRGERAYDIYSLLLKERIVFLGSPIDDQVANLVVAQLLYLNSQDPKKKVDLYIHSPGGSVYAGMAIYDTIKMMSAPVSTVAVGFTGSMATALLTSGAKGKRYALSHATVHMHPASGGAKGYTEDVRIATHEQERIQAQLFHIIGNNTGHTRKEIEELFLRDRFMSAPEAKDYGLVDEILGDIGDVLTLKNPGYKVSFFNSGKN
ncbi:ClpP family protease [Sinomicrobium weinanense]|uniref:ATP-dependent Clp protease proteolytic subunit n=1 Tax=Sinomicrobium weinanense TaxID=2842200 RepID=A0A926JV22_9FLAO|nr:ATP-dependent Clp protease proteolytic subunit [Sinomicrobium weinanense]MBC9797896.1 ATP-dependent Clp protease proteolytic subunit [Sinomicrobium weinanense]MBU3122770.1 ATP-dependent Clp protease proteolytic subunit [Sinomicrobium weinanense]